MGTQATLPAMPIKNHKHTVIKSDRLRINASARMYFEAQP